LTEKIISIVKFKSGKYSTISSRNLFLLLEKNNTKKKKKKKKKFNMKSTRWRWIFIERKNFLL